MKRLLLLSALALFLHVSSWAYNFSAANGDSVTIYYNISISSKKTCEVTYQSYANHTYSSDYSGIVAISETVTYNGTTYSVTSIGSSAFRNCTGMTHVTIGNGVTIIGDYAFYNCSGLMQVTIGNSVTSIDSDVFSYCI